MMGRLPAGQNQLFYEFCIEQHVPRWGTQWKFGYDRARTADFHGEDQVPEHSTFSKNRHGRYRDCELFRFVFESVVERCMAEGLVGGEGFAVDASLIKADANRKRGFSGKEGIKWERPGRKTRAVREYLDALDNDEQVVRAHEATRKAISLTAPASCWTSAPGGPANYSYSTNYLIDIDSAIIVGVEASPSTLSEEAQAARTMIDHTEKRFGVKPEHLAGDTAYGNAQMLGWLVEEKQITPHVPVMDKSAGKEGQFGRSEFTWKPEADCYLCPDGKSLGRNRRQFKNKRTGVTKANTIIYRASQSDCGHFVERPVLPEGTGSKDPPLYSRGRS